MHIGEHISAEEQDAYGLAGWDALERSLISRIAHMTAGVCTIAITVEMQVLVAPKL